MDGGGPILFSLTEPLFLNSASFSKIAGFRQKKHLSWVKSCTFFLYFLYQNYVFLLGGYFPKLSAARWGLLTEGRVWCYTLRQKMGYPIWYPSPGQEASSGRLEDALFYFCSFQIVIPWNFLDPFNLLQKGKEDNFGGCVYFELISKRFSLS